MMKDAQSDSDGVRVNAEVDIVRRYLADNEAGRVWDNLGDGEANGDDAVLRLLRASWRVQGIRIPPIEDDPVARKLGLVEATTGTVSVSGSAIKAKRRNSRKTVSQIDDALRSRGFSVPDGWSFDLEQRAATDIGEDLANGLADALGVTRREIETTGSSREEGGWAAFARSPRFRSEVERWASEHGLEVELSGVRALAGARIARGSFRKRGDLDEEDWANVLRSVLESWSG